jgi:hypothetical protein
LILTPNDNNNLLNNIDFSKVGNSISKDSNAFKKIQKFSKMSNNSLTRDASSDVQVFNKINNLYSTTNSVDNSSYLYGNPRQHNHASLDSFLPSFSTLVNKNGLEKFLSYQLNVEEHSERILPKQDIYNFNSENKTYLEGSNIKAINNLLSTKELNINDPFFLS